jgi:hypothetical protein
LALFTREGFFLPSRVFTGETHEAAAVPDVDSATINHVQYDRDARVLIVTFSETGTYRYFDVPEDIYDDMLASDPLEDYFNAHVYGRYRYMPQDERPSAPQ